VRNYAELVGASRFIQSWAAANDDTKRALQLLVADEVFAKEVAAGTFRFDPESGRWLAYL